MTFFASNIFQFRDHHRSGAARRSSQTRISGAEAKPDTKDADLYRQLFIDLEQLEDPVRLSFPGAEDKP